MPFRFPTLTPHPRPQAIHRRHGLVYYSDITADVIGVFHVEDSYWTKTKYRNASAENSDQSAVAPPVEDFEKPVVGMNLFTVKVRYGH